MVRLILILAFIAILAIAFAAVLGTLATMRLSSGEDHDTMPETFRKIAYFALVLLLLGLSVGWLGAA
ncbi:hypothetical protein [Cognatiyoonia sp. IB215182]|uniref:hypothetical protein n=1 Tax=Cognatiyoonia sp. IB215182 TaxID=3097353 RepID=UPI002A0FFD19|nr:hypothetical protein [Cognatiyoonia sp. IB215182]MDX8351035.1 hypothetical protein [Cognatiyoonia sp. IB215182]